jgi:ABC-type dipeptide/oligopeptide/nickel transport system ATPase component
VVLTRLRKSFDDVAAVDDISLEIGSGEFFSLLGPSGCGKTTSLRMIAGFERPDAGHIVIGDTDVTSTLRIDSTPSQPLAVVISPNAGILDGTVLDANQRPAGGVVVVVIPDLSRRKYFELYRTAVSNTSGRFHVEGIVPGDYKVFAWDDIEENSWQDPEVLRLYEDQGISLHVTESAKESIELRLR